MERPWPPEHEPPVKVMEVPELMAKQSSWFLMTAPVMVTPVDEPISKASVLWPPSVTSPAVLSKVISVTARVSAPLMDMSWTGAFLKLRPVMLDVVKEWA